MKNKFIIAAIAAPLLFGAMQSSAWATVTPIGNNVFNVNGATVNGAAHYSYGLNAASFFSSFVNEYLAAANFTSTTIQPFLGSWTGNYASPANGYSSYWNGTVSHDTETNRLSMQTTGYESYNYYYSYQVPWYTYTYSCGSVFSPRTCSNTVYQTQWGVGQSSSPTSFENSTPFNSAVTAVPGPEAGAGLGALAMLGVAYWTKRRRTEQTLAA